MLLDTYFPQPLRPRIIVHGKENSRVCSSSTGLNERTPRSDNLLIDAMMDGHQFRNEISSIVVVGSTTRGLKNTWPLRIVLSREGTATDNRTNEPVSAHNP